jgi:hypothetical protein
VNRVFGMLPEIGAGFSGKQILGRQDHGIAFDWKALCEW